MSVSAAHVSAVLARAGYPRASEPAGKESGFVVGIENASWATGGRVVVVGYQDYRYEGDYSDRATEAIHKICEEAFDKYALTLRLHGYTVENWMRYDGVRLGLFVTGRET